MLDDDLLKKLRETQAKQIDIHKDKKEKMEAIYTNVEKQMIELREITEKSSKLLKLQDLIITNRSTINQKKEQLKNIKIPKSSETKKLTEIIEKLEQLRPIEINLERTKTSLGKVRGQLSEIKLPKCDFGGLYTKLERVDILENLQKSLDKCQDKCYTLREKGSKIAQTKSAKKKEYYALIKSLKVCPTCEQEITEKCLEEIKL